MAETTELCLCKLFVLRIAAGTGVICGMLSTAWVSAAWLVTEDDRARCSIF